MGVRASRQKADITAPPTKESKKVKRRKSKKESITANGDSGIEEVSIQNTETDSIVKPEEIKPEETSETKKIEETTPPDVSTEQKSDTSNKENASPNLTEQSQVQSKLPQETSSPEVQKETQSNEPKEAPLVVCMPENVPSQEPSVVSDAVTPKQEELKSTSETSKEAVIVQEAPKPEEPTVAPTEVPKPEEQPSELPSEPSKPVEQPQIPISEVPKMEEQQTPASPLETPKSEPVQVPEVSKEEEQKPVISEVPKPEQHSPVELSKSEQAQTQVTETSDQPKELPKEEKAEVETIAQPSVPEEPEKQIASPESPKEPEKIIPEIKEQPATPILESPKSPELAPSVPADISKEETAAPSVSEAPKESEAAPTSDEPKEKQSTLESTTEKEMNNISEQTVDTSETNSTQVVSDQTKQECVSENTIEESSKTIPEEIKTDIIVNGENANAAPEIPVESKSPASEVLESPSEPIVDSQTKTTVQKILTTFTWEHGGKEVTLCGSFTNWTEKLTLTEKDNVFSTTYDVPEGEHYFQYYVDGVKTINNSLQKSEIQDHGEVNVIAIKASAE